MIYHHSCLLRRSFVLYYFTNLVTPLLQNVCQWDETSTQTPGSVACQPESVLLEVRLTPSRLPLQES